MSLSMLRRMVLNLGIDIPPPTLARDLRVSEFADVRFVAEAHAIVAHSFILEARCPYFTARCSAVTRRGGGLGGGCSSSQQSYGDPLGN